MLRGAATGGMRSNWTFVTDCFWSVMNLCDRLVYVLQRHADASVEGATLGIDIDGGIDDRDFGLIRFRISELAFVVSLNAPACFQSRYSFRT